MTFQHVECGIEAFCISLTDGERLAASIAPNRS